MMLRRPQVETPTASARMLAEATARISARRARDMMPVRIATRRLVLRAPIRGDVPDLVKLADNRNIADQLTRLPSPYTAADAIAFVEIFSQRADQRPYAITLDGNLIGVTGFSFTEGRPPELGYWLGEPYWGQGYATEAVKGVIEAAQATGQFRLIAARALARNTASLNVLEKAGFRKVGETTAESGERQGEPVVLLELEQPRWM
jgi:RimJ/RimL family protein N-acetyltransferase